LLTLAASYVGWRFPRMRPILEPEPLILIEDGSVIERNLKKERMTQEELAAEARIQQIDSLEKVKWAVLESGGQISFSPKSGRPRPRAPAPARALQGGGRRGAARQVSKFLQLALGILAAIGGFVDIGDLVFNVIAGATFQYQLLWVVVIGVVGIIVYSEMCGR